MSHQPFTALAGACALAAAAAAQPALTIYNQDFAVVRDRFSATLPAGESLLAYADATLHLEPASVILRDAAGLARFRVLEQTYRGEAVSAGLLLHLNEGRTLDFLVRDQDGREHVVQGRVIRSGYTPNTAAMGRFDQRFAMNQYAAANASGGGTPIVEVGGQLRFSLPGEPVFPSLGDDSVLRPTLNWRVFAPEPADFTAEVSYLTGGMRWEASYNLVLPEHGDTLDLVGWVTIDNQSGRQFDDASIKLLAGDVERVRPEAAPQLMARATAGFAMEDAAAVTEKAFDEFRLYTLPRPVTLRNREVKQVEFLRGEAVRARTLYVYNGAAESPHHGFRYGGGLLTDPDWGTPMNTRVWTYREIRNEEENGLGVPLPAGVLRFYRRDDADGRLEFVGENRIEHTPRGETVRLYTGNAFDIVGERRSTDFVLNNHERWMEEAFEVRLRNRKAEAVDIRVVERMARWANWNLVRQSHEHEKTDASTAEFTVRVEPDAEAVVTYRVRYSWK